MCHDGLTEAAALLAGGASAGDAVERAITRVEDNPAYVSVGYGGLPARDGHVLLDAGYMDGNALRYGGIMAAENIQNPIRAARLLCGRETNCLLAGRGAEQFAVSAGLPMRDMRTAESTARWREAMQSLRDEAPLDAYRPRRACSSRSRGAWAIRRSSARASTAMHATARRRQPAWARTSCAAVFPMRSSR